MTRAPGRRRKGAKAAAAPAATPDPPRVAAPQGAPPAVPAVDPDALADGLAVAIAQRAGKAPRGSSIGVLDCFAGSARLLRALMRHMPGSGAIGFEADRAAYTEGRHAIAAARAPVRLFHGDWRDLLPRRRLADDWRVVAILDPPAPAGDGPLDFGATMPPVLDAMAAIEEAYPGRPILYAIPVHEKVLAQPVGAIARRLDGPQVAMTGLIGPAGRHGVMLGTRGWTVS